MQDPYEILGVSRDADMDEIKKAYRQLSRKYHPDANINNPNKAQAEEKFKQVQQAYQKIVDEKEHGTSSTAGNSGSYGYGSSQNASGGYSQRGYYDDGSDGYEGYDPFRDIFGYGYTRQRRTQTDFGGNVELRAAANYINNGYYQEAMNVLDRINDRNGSWYYLHACANCGLGNNVAAKEDAEKAVQLEPNNQQFLQLLSQLQSGNGWYNDRGGMYGMDCSGTNALRCCIPLCVCCGLSRCCMPYGYGYFCC